MKGSIRRFWKLAFVINVASSALCAVTNRAAAQIFVSNVIGGPQNSYSGVIGEYSLDGAAINPALVGAVANRLVVSGSTIFSLFNGSGFFGSVGEYTTTGNVINSELITGLANPRGLAAVGTNVYVSSASMVDKVTKYNTTPAVASSWDISAFQLANGIAVSPDGKRLFVADSFGGTIGEFDAVTGAPINPALVSGLDYPASIAVSDSKLFVITLGDFLVGTVGAYSLDGAPINPSLITGLESPTDLAEFAGKLYIPQGSITGRVSEFDETTGAVIHDSLITGLRGVVAIAVVPEPTTDVLLEFGIALLLAPRLIQRRKQ